MVKAVKHVLFLVLIAVFSMFFLCMVASFFNAIYAVDSMAYSTCNNSIAKNLCEVYFAARTGAIRIFLLACLGILFAFFISLIILYIESVINE